MAEEQSIIIQEYAKNPLCNYLMENPTVSYHQGNFICGDDITVYLRVDGEIVADYSFDGNCSTITTAAASFLSEFIIGATISDIMLWTYDTFVQKGFEVSPRRRRAVVIALLASRNALHEYLHDGLEENFPDLILDL